MEAGEALVRLASVNLSALAWRYRNVSAELVAMQPPALIQEAHPPNPGELSRPISTARIPRLGHFAPHGVPASSRIGAGIPGTRTTLSGTRTHRLGGKKVTAHEGDCGGW